MLLPLVRLRPRATKLRLFQFPHGAWIANITSGLSLPGMCLLVELANLGADPVGSSRIPALRLHAMVFLDVLPTVSSLSLPRANDVVFFNRTHCVPVDFSATGHIQSNNSAIHFTKIKVICGSWTHFLRLRECTWGGSLTIYCLRKEVINQ